MKLFVIATAMATALIAVPAVLTTTPAYADCGDPDLPPVSKGEHTHGAW
jgi:hypothetical protein